MAGRFPVVVGFDAYRGGSGLPPAHLVYQAVAYAGIGPLAHEPDAGYPAIFPAHLFNRFVVCHPGRYFADVYRGKVR